MSEHVCRNELSGVPVYFDLWHLTWPPLDKHPHHTCTHTHTHQFCLSCSLQSPLFVLQPSTSQKHIAHIPIITSALGINATVWNWAPQEERRSELASSVQWLVCCFGFGASISLSKVNEKNVCENTPRQTAYQQYCPSPLKFCLAVLMQTKWSVESCPQVLLVYKAYNNTDLIKINSKWQSEKLIKKIRKHVYQTSKANLIQKRHVWSITGQLLTSAHAHTNANLGCSSLMQSIR